MDAQTPKKMRKEKRGYGSTHPKMHIHMHVSRQIQDVTAELAERAEAARRKRDARVYVVDAWVWIWGGIGG